MLVAQWVEHWTCNQQVIGSNPTLVLKLHNNLEQVVHLCASVTNGRQWSVAAGLAERNGSLPPGGWLIVTCRLIACTPGSTRDPTFGNKFRKPLSFTGVRESMLHEWNLSRLGQWYFTSEKNKFCLSYYLILGRLILSFILVSVLGCIIILLKFHFQFLNNFTCNFSFQLHNNITQTSVSVSKYFYVFRSTIHVTN